MIDLSEFLSVQPVSRKLGEFQNEKIESLKGKIPDDLLNYLIDSQKCVYGTDFLWTVLPQEFHDILSNWGLNGNDCFAFLRSSFGSIIYYYQGDIYILNSQKGIYSILGDDDLDYLFNIALYHESLLDEYCCYDLHRKYYKGLGGINEDEMYTLVPALILGGDYDHPKIEIVKMKEQLDILAQLYEHKLSE